MSSEIVEKALLGKQTSRRFIVAWRNTARPEISPVGALRYDSEAFEFWYLPEASQAVDFRPFLGFPDLEQVYRSKFLWPFFALRVMDRRRPDYLEYVTSLGLTPDASQLDILSRTGGERKGDSVQVIEEPYADADGATECTFLIRGSRYATKQYGTEFRSRELAPGDLLLLDPDHTNVVNPNALLVVTQEREPIGWVPDMLISYAQTVEASGSSVLALVRNNGPDAPWHLRFLVCLAGRVPIGYRPFPQAGFDAPPSR
jgi:hypothetical protein